jgi:hypothetical protein
MLSPYYSRNLSKTVNDIRNVWCKSDSFLAPKRLFEMISIVRAINDMYSNIICVFFLKQEQQWTNMNQNQIHPRTVTV